MTDRRALDEDMRVVTPPVPPVASTKGAIPTSLVDFSGAGSWNSGEAACREYTRQACVIMGIADTAAWANGMATIAGRETAFNSPAWQVNNTDSNAIGAIQSDGSRFQCSRGGWQCIPQTFAANHVAGTSYRIYDPVASVAAAMTYVMRNYNVARDGHNLAANVQQADPNRSPRGYLLAQAFTWPDTHWWEN